MEAVDLASAAEDLEVAESDVSRCHAEERGGGLSGLTIDREITADDGQCVSRWNAETGHGLRGEVLADGAAENGASVAPTGVAGRPRALELEVPAVSVVVDDLGEQDGSTVAELR